MGRVRAEASNEAYAVRIAKGAALITETRDLLHAWQSDESAAALAERVLETDLLGKATARRVKDIVQRVFAPRYLSPEECPAVYLKQLLETQTMGDWFRDLCLLYTARANRLVRDSITVLLRDAREKGVITIPMLVLSIRTSGCGPWSRDCMTAYRCRR